MSHKPLSYLPKQEISSPQLVLQVIFFWKCSKNVSIMPKKQPVGCSHHATFILIFSSLFRFHISSHPPIAEALGKEWLLLVMKTPMPHVVGL